MIVYFIRGDDDIVVMEKNVYLKKFTYILKYLGVSDYYV